MSGISTHILDVAQGLPAAGVQVTLERHPANEWIACGSGVTDADGRCRGLLAADGVKAGVHRLTFETGAYFDRANQRTLYPQVSITFRVERNGDSYHIPLLLSPFGYTTYRGS